MARGGSLHFGSAAAGIVWSYTHWDAAMMAARTMALGAGVRVANFHTLPETMAAPHKLLQET